MIAHYIEAALGRAEYKKLSAGTWFAEIPGFKGVWANGPTVEACRSELIEVLEGWILLKVRDRDPLPDVGIEIGITDLHAE